MSDTDFERRLAHKVTAYAESGVRPVDPYSVARSIAVSGRSSRWGGRTPYPMHRVVAPLLLVLTLLLVAGTLVIGSQLFDRRAVLVPPEGPDPVPSASPITPTPSSSPVVESPAAGPCAAMLQLFQTWHLDEASAGIPTPSGTGTRGNGDLLFSGLSERGESRLDRIDPTTDPPALVRPAEPTYPLPYAPGFPMSPLGQIAAAPDGRAVAVGMGDLGQAGCGEPLVLLAAGGIRRPFPVTAFQTVTDYAWAPDGSALFGVRRPTVDGSGGTYFDPDTGEVGDGPGTILRWDAGTGLVTDMGSACGSCGPLFVSPDGSHVATTNGERIVVRDAGGGWRTVATGGQLLGWATDGSLVRWGARIALDGTELATWEEPCCHGTGYAGSMSPDGSTLAGTTLSSDFLSHRVTVLDVRTGSAREIWSIPDGRGCTAFGAGSTGRVDCDAMSSRAPGTTLDPAGSASGYLRVVAWAPDSSAVVLLDQQADSSAASIWIVRLDGSGASQRLAITVPDLSATLGFPNQGPAVAWSATE